MHFTKSFLSLVNHKTNEIADGTLLFHSHCIVYRMIFSLDIFLLSGTVQKIVIENPAKRAKKESNETPKLANFSIKCTKKVVRDSCAGCIQKFVSSQVRIMHVAALGGKEMWYHVPCFARSRSELGWLESGEMLPGFKRLSETDQKMVEKQLP